MTMYCMYVISTKEHATCVTLPSHNFQYGGISWPDLDLELVLVCYPCWYGAFGMQLYIREHFSRVWEFTSCTSWEFIIFWKPIIFQNFWAMSFKNYWLTSYQNIYSNISFPKAVNKTCPCVVTILTSHHKVITSKAYYKVITSRYIKVITSRWRWPITDRFKIGRL